MGFRLPEATNAWRIRLTRCEGRLRAWAAAVLRLPFDLDEVFLLDD